MKKIENDSLVDFVPTECLSIPEFSHFFGLAIGSGYNLVYEKRVKVIRIGRRVLVPPAEVARILREGIPKLSETVPV